VSCQECKKEFDKLESEIKRKPNQRNFCSRSCYEKFRSFKQVPCAYCETLLRRSNAQLKKYEKQFCNQQCNHKYCLKKNDMTGKSIGRCTVIEEDTDDPRAERCWLLECACGERFSRRHRDVKKGHVYECPNCVFRRSQYYLGGKKYGRLSVQDEWVWKEDPNTGKRRRCWECVCECGNKTTVEAGSILSGHTVSCGCYMQKNCSRYVNETLYPQKHGLSRKEFYGRWTVLVHKCHNPKYVTYHNWGGKGYTVCDEWRNSCQSFYDWLIENKFTSDLTVELKKGCKEFGPTTCILVPIQVHHKNTRNRNRREDHGIDYQGERKTMKEWAEHFGIRYQTLASRYRKTLDLSKCIGDAWQSGSGQHLRRDDITDKSLIEMYQSGLSIAEIKEITGFTAVWERLKKTDVLMRPRKRKSTVWRTEQITKALDKGATFEEIHALNLYATKANLKKKMREMGVVIHEYEIQYGTKDN